MKKKICISILFIIILFLLSGCGYGAKQGTVVDKKFTPEHTTTTFTTHRVGKMIMSTPIRHHHKNAWSIKIQKEEDGKIKECWVSVTEEKYNELQIGDYYSEESV